MPKLVYITNTSVDGYIEDRSGNFNWVSPEPVFEFITELVRPIRTFLYGRKLYETMAYWAAPLTTYPAEQRDFAQVWQNHEKIVFSRTLGVVAAPNTRIEPTFDGAVIRKLISESASDVAIGGAELAALAFAADLIDECHLFLNPIVVGAGKPAFSPSIRARLELMETRSFDTGVIYARYAIARS